MKIKKLWEKIFSYIFFFVSSYLKMTAICITLYCSWYQRKSVLSNWGKIFTLIFLNWCYLQDKEAMCKINSPRLSRSHPGPASQYYQQKYLLENTDMKDVGCLKKMFIFKLMFKAFKSFFFINIHCYQILDSIIGEWWPWYF